MNYTALLPNGKTKDAWIASLKPGTHFCTRRPMKCSNCGENSLKHRQSDDSAHVLYCKDERFVWMPIPPKYVVGCKKCGKVLQAHRHLGSWAADKGKHAYIGKKYAICSGRGTGAICECGARFNEHKINYDNQEEPFCPESFESELPTKYKPLSCELISVMDESDWSAKPAPEVKNHEDVIRMFNDDSKLEGFGTWQQLQDWLFNHYGGRPRLWRYEFRR